MKKNELQDLAVMLMIAHDGTEAMLGLTNDKETREYINEMHYLILIDPFKIYRVADDVMEMLIELHQHDYKIHATLVPEGDYIAWDLIAIQQIILEKCGSLDKYLRMNRSEREDMQNYLDELTNLYGTRERQEGEYKMQCHNHAIAMESLWQTWMKECNLRIIDTDRIYASPDLMPKFLEWSKEKLYNRYRDYIKELMKYYLDQIDVSNIV